MNIGIGTPKGILMSGCARGPDHILADLEQYFIDSLDDDQKIAEDVIPINDGSKNMN